MLDQYHFEQYHRVYARPAIVLTVQWLHHFVQAVEIHCLIYFPKQMIFRYQAVYPYDFYYVTIHFSAFQHLTHHHLYFTSPK